MLKKRIDLAGLSVDRVPKDEAVLRTLAPRGAGEGARLVFTPNLKMAARAYRDGEMMRLAESADLGVADGVGIGLLSLLLGDGYICRIPGIELGEKIMEKCVRRGLFVYLLGAATGVAERAGENMNKKYGRVVVGTHHGYFSHSETDKICEEIDRSGADILFVCLGSPEQERFAEEIKDRLEHVRAVLCLGGSLDVWSGDKTRAPRALRTVGLEWLFRSISEPERLPEIVRSLSAFAYALKFRSKSVIKGIFRAYNQTDRKQSRGK